MEEDSFNFSLFPIDFFSKRAFMNGAYHWPQKGLLWMDLSIGLYIVRWMASNRNFFTVFWLKLWVVEDIMLPKSLASEIVDDLWISIFEKSLVIFQCHANYCHVWVMMEYDVVTHRLNNSVLALEVGLLLVLGTWGILFWNLTTFHIKFNYILS